MLMHAKHLCVCGIFIVRTCGLIISCLIKFGLSLPFCVDIKRKRAKNLKFNSHISSRSCFAKVLTRCSLCRLDQEQSLPLYTGVSLSSL